MVDDIDSINAKLVDWNIKLVSGLQLHESATNLIQTIISSVGSYCDSILLYGSFSNGTYHKNSDLDLLFITNTENDKRTTISLLEKIITVTHKPSLDYKVSMVDEIRSLSRKNQHFALWLILSHALVLNGRNVKNYIKLDYERVRNLLNDLLERINHSITDLSARHQYRGSCVQIAYVMRTLYYVEKHILRKRHGSERKLDYLERNLGNQYKLIEQVYHEDVVSKKTFGKLEFIQKIHSRKSFRYSPKQYSELLAICLNVEGIIIKDIMILQSIYHLP